MLILTPRGETRPDFTVPPTLIQIWLNDRGEPLTPEYERFAQKARDLHPGWEYVLAGNEALDLPDEAQAFGLADLLNRWGNTGYRSDILRLWLLWTLGGVYFDTDFEFSRSLALITEAACGLIGESFSPQPFPSVFVENCLLAFAPRHPYLTLCLERLAVSVAERLDTSDRMSVIDATGPGFLSRTLVEYRARPESLFADVSVLPARLLWPRPPGAANGTGGEIGTHHWNATWVRESAP